MGFLSILEARRVGTKLIKEQKGGLTVLMRSYVERIDLLLEKSEPISVFLSHSSDDTEAVLGAVHALEKLGYSVYVDWMYRMNKSGAVPFVVNSNTVDSLQSFMENSIHLFYLHTDSAKESKWCPWELGYFHAMSKPKEGVYVLPLVSPLVSHHSPFKGQEYLDIYPRVEIPGYDPSEKVLLLENINFDEYAIGRYPNACPGDEWEICYFKRTRAR